MVKSRGLGHSNRFKFMKLFHPINDWFEVEIIRIKYSDWLFTRKWPVTLNYAFEWKCACIQRGDKKIRGS
jgi:hypothetical protein